MPEEEAFAVLVSLMQDFTMRDMYKPDMFYLGLCIYQLECMVQVCQSFVYMTKFDSLFVFEKGISA